MGTIILYNSILLFAVCCAYVAEHTHRPASEKMWRFFMALVLVLPAALRAPEVGTDTRNYIEAYNIPLYMDSNFEIGFLFLCNCLRALQLGQYSVMWMTAILTIAPLCHCLPKKHLTITMFFYIVTFYLLVLTSNRQTMAISYCIWAMFSLNSPKWPNLKYCVLVAIAISVHTSAIVMLPLVFLKRVSLSPKWYFAGLVTLVALLVSYNVMEMLSMISFISESRYATYTMSSNMFNRATSMGSGLGVAIRWVLPLMFLWKSRTFNEKMDITPLLSIMCVCYMASYVLAMQIHIFTRLVMCFAMIIVLLAGPVVESLSERMRVLFRCGLIFVFILSFEKDIVSNDISAGTGLGIYPYKWVFFS